MPAGSKPGERRGGKQKGSVNKKTQDVIDKLVRLKCDPIEGMATIAENRLPCGVCRNKGTTRFKLEHPVNCPDCFCKGSTKPNCKTCLGTGIKNWSTRVCESCHGELFEACSPDLRARMFSDLAGYVYSKRKAIEISGTIGMPDIAALLRERFTKREKAK